MARYKIKHAFNLPSGKLLTPGMYYLTEDADELAKLASVVKDGACEELVSKPKEEVKPETPPVDPAEDLASVSGIGAKAMKKLHEAGVTTKSQLKAAVLDPAKEGAMKEIL